MRLIVLLPLVALLVMAIMAHASQACIIESNITISNVGEGLFLQALDSPYHIIINAAESHHIVINKNVTMGVYIFPLSIGNYSVLIGMNCNEPLPILGIRDLITPGISSTYPINTTSVLGFFNLTDIYAITPHAPNSTGISGESGASIELNAVLTVELEGGRSQQYWLQDIVQMSTAIFKASLIDNIWNFTSPSSNMNNEYVEGAGHVYEALGQYSNRYYYAYDIPNALVYYFPFAGYLIINESVEPGLGVIVYFGYAKAGSTSNPYD
ncbi:MAG: thermopsin family protease, partial [Thermocladium sp.]